MDENLTEGLSAELEEASERQTINYMAVAVVIVGAVGLLILALRPFLKQMRAEEVAAAVSAAAQAEHPAEPNGAGA